MIDAAELRLFGDALRRATQSCSGPALDDVLLDLGWAEALEAAPEVAIRLLFAAQGAAGATSSALPLVLAAGLGTDPAAGVLLPAAGESAPPGQLRDGRVLVRGLLPSGAAGRDTVLVPTTADDKHVLLMLAIADLQVRQVAGLDPDLDLVELHGEVAAVDPAPMPHWPTALRLGRVAVGHELVGAGRTMLELARVHALDREQFGRPIAGFQAVRHRLAEALVALESAQALLDAAELDRSEVTAAMAKASAGRAARTTARHCQQVLAGIGFTTEHRFHRFVRRTLVLDQLLGSSRTLTRELGEQVLASRHLPLPLPL